MVWFSTEKRKTLDLNRGMKDPTFTVASLQVLASMLLLVSYCCLSWIDEWTLWCPLVFHVSFLFSLGSKWRMIRVYRKSFTWNRIMGVVVELWALADAECGNGVRRKREENLGILFRCMYFAEFPTLLFFLDLHWFRDVTQEGKVGRRCWYINDKGTCKLFSC